MASVRAMTVSLFSIAGPNAKLLKVVEEIRQMRAFAG